MANIIEINDLRAPELEVYARLTEVQLRSRQHPERALFIAESIKVIEYALAAGCVPVSFLMERRQIEGAAAALIRSCPEVPVYTAERNVLADLTGYALTRGVLCAMRRPEMQKIEDVCAGARRIAVLEGIVDAGNLGAIFRSAAALNMDAVLLSPTCCDPLSRRAARVSMGTVFQIPWTRIGSRARNWPDDGISMLKQMGFRIASMALSAHSVSVEDEKLMAEEKLAIILGTEGGGLQDETIALSDYTVRIPMGHDVDSLNVAAASAVAFWQLRIR